MERVFRREIVRRLFFVFMGVMREYPLYTPYGHAGIVVDCPYDRTMFESVLVMRLSTPPVHAGVAAACPCGRTLRSCSDVFPCGTAVRGRWTGVFVLVVPALWPRV